jgi:hypothetical protein
METYKGGIIPERSHRNGSNLVREVFSDFSDEIVGDSLLDFGYFQKQIMESA